MVKKIISLTLLAILSTFTGFSQNQDVSYSHSMTKDQQKALKATVIADWGQPTLSHTTRVISFDGPNVVVQWKRYNGTTWEKIILKPKFTMKSKWRMDIIYDWVRTQAKDIHFRNRFYTVRNDHDFVDAAWAAAEHFERYMRMIGIPVDINYMTAVDYHGREVVVKDIGKSMTKPAHFNQIETGKKRP